MQLSGFPNVSTVEELFLWSAVALDNKSYPAIQLNDSITPTSPVSVQIGRVTASSRFNHPYVRVTADLPLNPETYNTIALYACAEELVTNDTLPPGLSDGLLSVGDGGGGDQVTTPSLYSLPFDVADFFFWFAGEKMDQETGIFYSPVRFEDINTQELSVEASGEGNYIAFGFGQPGMLFPDSTSPNILLPSPIDLNAFSMIICMALSTDGDYVALFDTYNGLTRILQLGRWCDLYQHPAYLNSADTYFNVSGIDEGLHIYHCCLDAVSADFYLDGVLVHQIAASDSAAFAPITVDSIFMDQGSLYFVSDFCCLNRKITSQEVSDSYHAIATHRGLI